MCLPDRKICLAQMMPQTNAARKCLRAAVIHFFQSTLHHITVRLCRDALYRPINRQDALLRYLLRILQNPSAVFIPDATIEKHFLPNHHLLAKPRLIVPYRREFAAIIPQGRRNACQSSEAIQFRGLSHLAFHQYSHARLAFGARRHLRHILVANRKAIQKIAQ